jgi:anti-sigma B factor antagonist
MMKRSIFGAGSGTAGRRGEAAAAQPGELLSLSSGPAPAGAVVTFAGELDLASAEQAFGYVRDVIDRHHTLVVLDLAALSFCDARGLGTLVRLHRYAGQAGCALRLMSPRPWLLEIMRLTSLDRELTVQPCDPAGLVAC